jgi:NADPH:quinone reductase-like Zn-dependent oxidoreductase
VGQIKMKAIVQEGYGSPDVLKLRDIDQPVVGDDHVLVKVRAASVNALDWHLMHRLPHLIGTLMRKPWSRIRGVDVAGHVERVGKNVTRFKPGDEVFGNGKGTFAEYVTTSEGRLAPKPRNLTFEQAAAIPVAGLTALQGLRDKASVQPGRRVLIYGAGGGVGTFAVQIAKSFGARVTAVSSTMNLDLLRSIGAGEVIDYTKEDFTRRGERYHVLFDIGANRSIEDCRRVLLPNGTFLMVGAPKGTWAILSRLLKARLLSRAGGQRIASFMARVRREDLAVLKDLAESGKLSPVIDRRYPLSEVPDAIRLVGTGAARGKVVIQVA